MFLTRTLWGVVLLLAAGPAGAAERRSAPVATKGFAPRVRERVVAQIQADAARRLDDGIQNYLKGRRNPLAAQSALIAGLGAEGAAEIARAYAGVTELPGVNYENGVARLREAGNEVSIDAEDAREGTVRVNGKKFRWDRGLGTAENLRRYDALFSKPSAGWSWIREAHAQEDVPGQTFTMKVLGLGGLTLYFNIPRADGKLFANLEAEAGRTLDECEASRQEGASDTLTTALATQNSPQANTLTHVLSSCRDLEKFADSLTLALPPTLCTTLDDLSRCLAEAHGLDPNAQVTDQRKKPDLSVWTPGSISNGRQKKNAPSQSGDTTSTVH